MLQTKDWIQWLLERGWTLRFNAQIKPRESVWEWRDLRGISGDDYQSPDFDILPPAVERHIMANALMQPEYVEGS